MTGGRGASFSETLAAIGEAQNVGKDAAARQMGLASVVEGGCGAADGYNGESKEKDMAALSPLTRLALNCTHQRFVHTHTPLTFLPTTLPRSSQHALYLSARS
jgi:hypothetical protein